MESVNAQVERRALSVYAELTEEIAQGAQETLEVQEAAPWN